MKHPPIFATAALAAVTLALAACSSSVKLDDKQAAVETRSVAPGAKSGGAGTGAAAGAVPQSQVATVSVAPTAIAAASNLARVIYFDFDSFVIKDEFRALLDAHAKSLSTVRGKRMIIEGHTDERGGREYNLALGQKRAEAVLKSLQLVGAGDAQLEAVSFGEERPAEAGHDEAAWAKNRRAELKDR